MIHQPLFFHKLLTQDKRIFSISGESGTGKTTLALQLVGYVLTFLGKAQGQCVWIQASEIFPAKRLLSLYNQEPKILKYLHKNIFVIPKKPFHSYLDQSCFFENIKGVFFPPETKVIVIDNISHYLRFEVLNQSSPGAISNIMNTFYDTQLFPLIMYCQREEIILLLIHEVSFNPDLQQVKPFYYKLFSRIRAVEIMLEKQVLSAFNLLHIRFEDSNFSYKYQIKDCGLIPHK